VLALAAAPIGLFSAWAVLGVGMALGLYDSGFAALASIYGDNARGPITGITLFAGFASTISWPLSTVLNEAVGWRETCLAWAILNLVIGLPLNRFVFPATVRQISKEQKAAARVGWKPNKEMLLLAFVFAAVWFVTGAMASHLPTLLQRAGVTQFQAVAAAALVGPAQVAVRIVGFVVLRRIHPVVSARIAASLHPLAPPFCSLLALRQQ
jgi:predicted MFS family arabinose efflux permease